MKKKVFFVVLLLVVIAAFIIPATQQQTVLIKKSFLPIYKQLATPEGWEHWRPDLKKEFITDSTKFSVKKDTTSFTIDYAGQQIEIRPTGGLFDIVERAGKNLSYSYAIAPDKQPNKTYITVYKNTNLVNYLIGTFKTVSFEDTHIADFKHFMETDSLYYGYNIVKVRIPGDKLLVIIKQVLNKDKFETGGKMMEDLKGYLKTNNITSAQPPISQFVPKGKDSTIIKVGFYVDKELKPTGEVTFERMPKGAADYSAMLHGKYIEKSKVYAAINQYMADHLFQKALLPFETYFDGKLPTSDTSQVNIRVNFGSYF